MEIQNNLITLHTWKTDENEFENQYNLFKSIKFNDNMSSFNKALVNGFDVTFSHHGILHSACRNNDFPLVKRLLEEFHLDPNAQSCTGFDDGENTPLIDAIWSNNIQLIDYLLEKGANAREPWIVARIAAKSCHYDIFSHMIEKGLMHNDDLSCVLDSICHKYITEWHWWGWWEYSHETRITCLEDIIIGIRFILNLIEKGFDFNNSKESSSFWEMKDYQPVYKYDNINVYPNWFKKLMEMDTLEEQQHWIFHQKHKIKFASCLEHIYGHPDLERTKTEQLVKLNNFLSDVADKQ